MRPGNGSDESNWPGEFAAEPPIEQDLTDYAPPHLDSSDIIATSQMVNAALFSLLNDEAVDAQMRPLDTGAKRVSTAGPTESASTGRALPQSEVSDLENPEDLPAPAGPTQREPDRATDMMTAAPVVRDSDGTQDEFPPPASDPPPPIETSDRHFVYSGPVDQVRPQPAHFFQLQRPSETASPTPPAHRIERKSDPDRTAMHPGHELKETDPPGEYEVEILIQTAFCEYVPPPLDFSDIVSTSQLESGVLFSSLQDEAIDVQPRPRNIEVTRTSAHGTTEFRAPGSALPLCDKSGLENPEILPAPPRLAVQGPDMATGMRIAAPISIDTDGSHDELPPSTSDPTPTSPASDSGSDILVRTIVGPINRFTAPAPNRIERVVGLIASHRPGVILKLTPTAAPVTAPTRVDRTGEPGTDGLTALPTTPAILARPPAKPPWHGHADALLPCPGIATQGPTGRMSADTLGTHRRCEASRTTRCRRGTRNGDARRTQRPKWRLDPNRETTRALVQVSAPSVTTTMARAHLIGNERLRSTAPPLMKFG